MNSPSRMSRLSRSTAVTSPNRLVTVVEGDSAHLLPIAPLRRRPERDAVDHSTSSARARRGYRTGVHPEGGPRPPAAEQCAASSAATAARRCAATAFPWVWSTSHARTGSIIELDHPPSVHGRVHPGHLAAAQIAREGAVAADSTAVDPRPVESRRAAHGGLDDRLGGCRACTTPGVSGVQRDDLGPAQDPAERARQRPRRCTTSPAPDEPGAGRNPARPSRAPGAARRSGPLTAGPTRRRARRRRATTRADRAGRARRVRSRPRRGAPGSSRRRSRPVNTAPTAHQPDPARRPKSPAPIARRSNGSGRECTSR